MDLSGSKSLSLGGLGFDGAIEQMSGVFGAFGGRATGQRSAFRWSTNFASAGALTLVSSRYEGEWEMWPIIERPEILVISRAHQGALDLTLGNRAAQANARSLLFASSAEADRLSLRGPLIQSDVLCIDWSIIAKMASSTFDRPLSGSLALAPELDITAPPGQAILSLIDTISTVMQLENPMLRAPLAVHHMTEALANLILLTVPNRFSRLLEKTPPAIAPRHVKLAVDFMHANIGRPITIQSVALAAGTSSRSLEVGFRSFKGTTPAAYLRTIRLQAARSDLCDPASTRSTSEIALRWGFFHLGRFAKFYKDAYGEAPSETRRRSSLRL